MQKILLIGFFLIVFLLMVLPVLIETPVMTYTFVVTALLLPIILLSRQYRWMVTVVIFVVLYGIRGLYPPDLVFFNIITPDNLAVAFLIAIAHFDRTVIKVRWASLDDMKRYALFIVIALIFLLPHYILLKSIIFMGDGNYATLIKRVIRDGFLVYAYYCLITRIYDPRTRRGIEYGFLIAIVVGVTSMLFINFFISLGFYLHIRQSGRQTGLFLMNANAAAAFFMMVFGFILAKIEKTGPRRKFYYFTLTGFLFIGLMLTASKTGFIISLVLSLYFILRNKLAGKQILAFAAVFFIFGLSLFTYGDFMRERMLQQIEAGPEGDTAGGRLSHWTMYANDLRLNPYYFIAGNTGHATYQRDVHNTYIYIIFHAGLIYFIAVLILFYKIYKRSKKLGGSALPGSYTPIYSLAALFLAWFTGSGVMNFWLPLILAMSTGILKKPIRHKSNNRLLSPSNSISQPSLPW